MHSSTKFTGHVWQDIFKLARVKLCMSTAFHPQTDGQSEVVNKAIAMYFRCITGDKPHSWLEWILWAECCYNMAYHSALQTTPFQVVYGCPPPALVPYQPVSACTATVDELLQERDVFHNDVCDQLLQAQQFAKRFYDAHHHALEFAVSNGSGYAYYIAPLAGTPSSVRATPDPSRCLNASGLSLIGFSCQSMPISTTCSTLEFVSHIMVLCLLRYMR